MPLHRRHFISALGLALAISGCPLTDDYYVLSADGDSGAAGRGGAVSSGSSSGSAAGRAPGDTAGTTSGSSTGRGGDGATGGADGGKAGPGPMAGKGGSSSGGCSASAERCNGRDDDCDGAIDEFPACPGNCYGFVLPTSAGEHGYMFCTSSRKANWDMARAGCDGQQMRLAWLDSASENQAVAQKLADIGTDLEVMIGATDQAVEGEWLWYGGEQFWNGNENGEPVPEMHSAWAAGTPNNNNNEDCVLLNSMTGTWGDRSCAGIYPYLCEQPD